MVVAKDQLQDKSDRYYFQESSKRRPGEVYVSPLDLNVEHQGVEVPHRSMLRVGAPVVGAQGERLGIIIVNYLGDVMLDAYKSATGQDDPHIMLTNSGGFFLRSPNPSDEWGFMFNRPELTLAARSPEAWRLIVDAEVGQVMLPDGIWTWQTVRPLLAAKGQGVGGVEPPMADPYALDARQYFWKSVARLSADTVSNLRWAAWREVSGGLVLATVLLGLVCWRLAHARLARALAEAEVVRTNAHLEQTVHERTHQLQGKVAELAREVAERQRAQEEADSINERYRLATEAINAGAWEFDLVDGTASRSLRHDVIFGYPEQLPRWDFDLFLAHVLPIDRSRVGKTFQEAIQQHTHWNFECRIRRVDGDIRWIRVMGQHTANRKGHPCLAGMIEDISERKQRETRLRLAASVFTHAREGIAITDTNGTVLEVNDTFTKITGYPREEVVGHNPRILNSGRQDRSFYAGMWLQLTTQGHWTGELWNRRKNGEIFPVILTISAIRDDAGATQHYVSLFSDITTIKAHHSELERIAHHDTLTGLPNRLLLADRLGQAISQSDRRDKTLAVVYLDLDDFKSVNDTFGHGAGDAVLIAVSHRMKDALRDGDTLARLGGDEFVAVLTELDQPDDCLPIIERLLSAATAPFDLSEHANPNGVPMAQAVQVSASIGATLYPKDKVGADQLLRHADQAMYLAKQAGKNQYHLFDVAQDAAIHTLREDLQRFSRALQNNELVLHYQPKVNIRTGEVLGAEALIRWQHPERGLLPPGVFLHTLENHPLSIEMGEWILAQALTQIGAWNGLGLELQISVNIGALQLQQPNFADRLGEMLKAHPAAHPGQLRLEIVETSALQDIARVSRTMFICKALGVGFSLDDFGTGYSSLTYLRRLPAEMLKIDQSFVRDMITDPDDLAIVKGVIQLAGVFQRRVIAEGVETKAHGDLLMDIGCDLAQGYGIARPMPAADFPGWVAKWRAEPVWTA